LCDGLESLLTRVRRSTVPRATLTFELPDEQREFLEAANAGELASALFEIEQRLRGIIKHGNPSEEAAAIATQIRQMISDLDPIVS